MVEQFIEHFTYLGLFLVLFSAGLGVPIPEEAAILAAGVLAREGVVRWWLALPICMIGVMGGDVALYWVGHHWGERVLNWRIVRWVLTPEREKTLLERYRRHGVKIVFAARHIMGVRAAAFLTAGIARVAFWKFFAVDLAAACLGVPFGFFVGYVATDQLERVMADIHRIERVALFVGFVAAAIGVLYLCWRQGKKMDESEP